MKKVISIAIVALLLFTAVITVLADNGGTIVFITSSGSKYHKEGCSSLKGNGIQTTLKEAVEKGLTPCSKCNPPEYDSSSDSSAQEETSAAVGSAADTATDTDESSSSGMNPWLAFFLGVVVGVVGITVIRNKFGDAIMTKFGGEEKQEEKTEE